MDSKYIIYKNNYFIYIHTQKNCKYTCKEGDIWAYGVTVCEIYELGRIKPYQDRMEKVTEISLREFLETGKRLNKPSKMPPDLWGKVRSCFATDKSVRPKFASLFSKFSRLEYQQGKIQDSMVSESFV